MMAYLENDEMRDMAPAENAGAERCSRCWQNG